MGATLPCNMTSSLWSLDEYLLDTYRMASAALLREETESLLSTSFNGTAGDTYTGGNNGAALAEGAMQKARGHGEGRGTFWNS